MEDKTEDKHDPGWNDPPIFTYDKATAIQATAARKGTLLNKRVAYPMTGKPVSTSTSPVVSSITPTVPLMAGPPICPIQSVQISTCGLEAGEPMKLSKHEKLDRVLKNLEMLVPVNDENEISKRIKIMEKMWIDDKLNEHVQSKLLDLTEALCKGDIEVADHLQKGLMVDYVSQCSSWMSGIRHLINYKRNGKGD